MRLSRRRFVMGLGVSVFGMSAASKAAGPPHFDSSAFEAAQGAGRSILIHVTAPWCGTCRAQKPIVAELIERPEFENMTVFEVDFDTEKDVLRRFGVQTQSTMIVFKGTVEAGRSVGQTAPAAIEALLRQAL